MLPLAFAALAFLQGAAPQSIPPAPTPLPTALKPAPAPDAVVATVDGKPITAAEVAPYLWAWNAQRVIRELADHRMVQAAAAKRGLTATDAEVKAKFDAQMDAVRSRLKPGQTPDDFLAGQGLDSTHLLLASRSAVLLDKIADADFKPAEFVKVDTILFAAPQGGSTDVLGKAIKGADAAYASLAAGKGWDAVVKANTTVVGPSQAAPPAQAGPLGWKSLDTFPEAIRAQIVALKPFGTTKPLQTPSGIQIFRLAARGTDAPAAELAALKAQYVAGSRGLMLQKLREATKVEIK